MRDVDVFQQALGLTPPWRVEEAEFDPEAGRLDLYLDFPPGSEFSCPACEREGCKAYDTTEKTWRHLNFFEHRTYLHARVPRAECAECGVKLVEVPWAREGSGFTLLFEGFVLALVKAMPVAAVARLVGEHDTRLWRILHHYVDRAREEADFSDVTHVGVDETSARRGHNYITLFCDLDEAKVLFATEGHDHTTFGRFRLDLLAHGGRPEQVTEFCMDMSAAFRKGAERQFPKAGIVFDKFHVMKLVNDAVDEVRRAERKERPELKRSRYVWLKNPANLTQKQRALLEALIPSKLGLKTGLAYRIKLALQEFWALPPALAEAFLEDWYFWATHSRLEPIIRVAHTLKEHWDGILHWFRARISNGILEAINSLVQAAKAKARGYRTARNLITIVYLTSGKLDLPSTHLR
jgi:transposase